MKKLFVLFFLICFFLISFASCTGTQQAAKLTSSAPNKLSKAAENVCFKEGAMAEGTVVLSAKNIEGFYYEFSKSRQGYQIVFQLTDEGKNILSEETTKLSKTNGVISFWIGDELIASPEVVAPITSGRFTIIKEDLNEQNIAAFCNKLQGK